MGLLNESYYIKEKMSIYYTYYKYYYWVTQYITMNVRSILLIKENRSVSLLKFTLKSYIKNALVYVLGVCHYDGPLII